MVVGTFFNDHASLRRYLVDDGSSTAGGLWRVGGRGRVSWHDTVLRSRSRARAAERDLPIGSSAVSTEMMR